MNLPHTHTCLSHIHIPLPPLPPPSLQEADRIEPILYPLLRMDLDRQGPRFVVQIGDKQIDYNETFRWGWGVGGRRWSRGGDWDRDLPPPSWSCLLRTAQCTPQDVKPYLATRNV